MTAFRTRYRSLILGALVTLLLLNGAAQAWKVSRWDPVPVEPDERDEHTLFLATFEGRNPERADFARGSAAMKFENARAVPAPGGRGARLGKLSIAPEGNIDLKKGTIEVILRDVEPQRRQRFLHVRPAFQCQLGGALWFNMRGPKKNAWVHDVNLKETFPQEWMYVVIGWDTERNIQSVAVYNLDGRWPMNNPSFKDHMKHNPEAMAALRTGKAKSIELGGPGIEVDVVRISNAYREELFNPQPDYGPIERWGAYGGGEPIFDETTQVKH